jgi:predicted sugar kinase
MPAFVSGAIPASRISTTRVDQSLTENEFTKVLIRCQQDGIGLTALAKHGFIVGSGLEFSYGLNIVAVSTKSFNDLHIYVFVSDDIQLTFSKG